MGILYRLAACKSEPLRVEAARVFHTPLRKEQHPSTEEIEKAAQSAVLTNNLTQIQVLSLAVPQ